MIAPQALLRAFDPATYDAIQAFKVTDPALMPWDYQAANPAGRIHHAVFQLGHCTSVVGVAGGSAFIE